MVTNGLRCFKEFEKAGCVHEHQIVGIGRKSTSMWCFDWVINLLGNLKTAITGTYDAFGFGKYVHRHLSEAQYRFNRRFELKSMLSRLLFACSGTGKRPEACLRLAESQFRFDHL